MIKKAVFPLLSLMIILVACNSGDKKSSTTDGKETSAISPLDSIVKIIEEGHNIAMSKIGRMHNTEKRLQAVADSISKLPAKTQQALSGYVESIKTTISDLNYADMAMDKWMMEYDEDSAKANVEKHLQYLKEESSKIGTVRAHILNGLQKADSLLKSKL